MAQGSVKFTLSTYARSSQGLPSPPPGSISSPALGPVDPFISQTPPSNIPTNPNVITPFNIPTQGTPMPGLLNAKSPDVTQAPQGRIITIGVPSRALPNTTFDVVTNYKFEGIGTQNYQTRVRIPGVIADNISLPSPISGPQSTSVITNRISLPPNLPYGPLNGVVELLKISITTVTGTLVEDQQPFVLNGFPGQAPYLPVGGPLPPVPYPGPVASPTPYPITPPQPYPGYPPQGPVPPYTGYPPYPNTYPQIPAAYLALTEKETRRRQR
jgi:hypothetical protein